MNVGNPHEMTLLELAQEVRRLTRTRSKLVFRPLPEDDPRVRQPDIHRAMKILHWEPRVKLSDGLSKTITYFRRSLKKE